MKGCVPEGKTSPLTPLIGNHLLFLARPCEGFYAFEVLFLSGTYRVYGELVNHYYI